MDPSANQPWLRRAMLFGGAYLAAGIVFGALAGASASGQMRVAWRLAAWLVSAAAFAANIGYERYRLRNRPLATASHASAATALGAFGLAVAANVHALRAASGHRGLLTLALVLWPVLTAVPAFVVAFTAAAVLARTRRSA